MKSQKMMQIYKNQKKINVIDGVEIGWIGGRKNGRRRRYRGSAYDGGMCCLGLDRTHEVNTVTSKHFVWAHSLETSGPHHILDCL